MKQKIEWYREVLDLEPGSRVFFPLAKLLAANGQTADAVNTLRQGLVRHPDNVEARLLLVELLYLQDDDAGVQSEINHLGGTFSLYPVFWKAWSDRLSEKPESHDASLALRFFAAALQGKSINWADVVVQGLRAVLQDAEIPSAPRRTGTSVNVEAAPELATQSIPQETVSAPLPDDLSDEMLAGISEDIPAVFEEDVPDAMPGEPQTAVIADQSAAQSQEAPSTDIDDLLADNAADNLLAGEDPDFSPDDVLSEASTTPDAFALEADADFSPDDELPDAAMPSESFAGEEADLSPDDLGMDFPVPGETSGADISSDTGLSGEEQGGTTQDSALDSFQETDVAPAPEDTFASPAAQAEDVSLEDDGEDSAPDDEEEAFSLRTRSMAEVLAEQGDIAGALDIYKELLTACSDEERPGLASRAEELQLRLESPASSEHRSEERAVQPGTESSRLVNLLESLAQRLEDRAR